MGVQEHNRGTGAAVGVRLELRRTEGLMLSGEDGGGVGVAREPEEAELCKNSEGVGLDA